jgi:hypothetical protein
MEMIYHIFFDIFIEEGQQNINVLISEIELTT